MLDRLYKKLHVIFTGGIMLILFLIIGIVAANHIRTQKINDSTFFQRMATILIYQLQNADGDFEAVIKPYENNYSMFAFLEDSNSTVVYEGKASYPTDTGLLLERFEKQKQSESSFSFGEQTTTVQGGIFEITGAARDNYWGIASSFLSDDENSYDLTLIYHQKSLMELLKPQLPLYILIWISSFAGIALISRFILKKAFQPTETVLKSQKDFVASASHELKSPLAVILANAETIGKLSTDCPGIQKSARLIDSECMRMSKLIKNMLLLAASDAKTELLNNSRIDVDTLLISLYETYEPICVKHKISLKLELNDMHYPAFSSDRERIFQILSIYMDNAVEHAKNSSVIQIQTLFTASHITFFIIDHGQGIDAKDKPYIFNRFYCADKSHTDKSHFGLGLGIADELAKTLNGTAGFKDTDGGGATFFVTLPLK